MSTNSFICDQYVKICRWEYSAIDTLPEYMRKSYKALLDTTNSIAQKVEERFGTNPIDSLKDTVRVTNLIHHHFFFT